MPNKEEVLARLCALSNEVMDKRHQYSKPADCFCTLGREPSGSGYWSFEFSEDILAFIEAAVNEKLATCEGEEPLPATRRRHETVTNLEDV